MSIFWHNITSFGKVSLAINQPIKSYRSFFENTFRRFTNFHQKSLYLWKRIRLIKKILLRQKSSIPLTLNRVKYTVGEHKAIYLRPLVCGKSHLVCLMSFVTIDLVTWKSIHLAFLAVSIREVGIFKGDVKTYSCVFTAFIFFIEMQFFLFYVF